MVQNPVATRVTADPLATVAEKAQAMGRPIRFEDLSEEDLLSIVESARPYSGRRRDSYHIALARQWWINLLYYIGYQSFDVPEQLADMDPGMLASNGGYVANHVLRLVLGSVARLTSAKVDWSVVPNTPDQADQDGARVAQNLLDHLHEHLDLPDKRTEVCLWLDICGTAFAYTGWDTSKGQTRRFYRDPFSGAHMQEQQVPPQQKQWLDKLELFTEENDGDHDSEILSPFDVWLPPRFRTLEQMPWVMIRRTMSLEAVWDRWPDKAAELPLGEPANPRLDHYRNRLATLAKRPGLSLTSAHDDDGAVDIDEWWYPPSKRCPQGLFIAATGQKILESSAHKFAAVGLDTRFPLVDFHNMRVPGRFHSMSTVEHLIGPQTEYNKSRQQVIQHRDVISVPQWMAPIGCISQNVVRNELGDIMEYHQNKGTPTLVNPPPLGDAQLVSGQQAQSDMQMIASFSEASLGQMPQGARSGNAVTQLQERDTMGVTPTVRNLERSFQKWGRNMLLLEWKFRKFPQAVQIYGESRQADIRYFSGSDLNGNCRVTVKAGSLTPRSKSETFQRITELLQLGAINPQDPRQQRLVMETLEVGGTDKLWLLIDGHRRRASIENQMFAKPPSDPNFSYPDVMQYDDHQVHYEKHQEWMLTDEFELLHPMAKMHFLAHVQKHVGAVALQMEALATVNQAAGGGSGQGSGSPDAKPLGKASPPRQNPKQSVASGSSNP